MLHSSQRGADTDQLWQSCMPRLLLGEVALTHGHMPGTPVLVSHLLGEVTLTHESRMPGTPLLELHLLGEVTLTHGSHMPGTPCLQ